MNLYNITPYISILVSDLSLSGCIVFFYFSASILCNWVAYEIKKRVLSWKYIYILPRIVTSDPYTRYFQYKVLNNALYLNEKLFIFGISESSRCYFCNQSNEKTEHLLCNCFVAKALQNGFLNDLTTQAAFLTFRR